ncbi:MAG: 4-hydroxythreonine-4-phosphate dehydrogenase PdxA [Parvularculaceae bacterium]
MDAAHGRPLALTMGEPGGIGPEITIKAYRELSAGGPAFFVFADPALFTGAGVEIVEIKTPADAAAGFKAALPIIPLQNSLFAKTGRADRASAPAVIESIERAVGAALAGDAAGVVTNPIQKSSLLGAGFKFPGHTEFESLSRVTATASRRKCAAVMMIAGPDLKTVPITIHQSVREAAASLRVEMIVEKALVVAEALKADFGIERPKLAISGLNPHAGENGHLGGEEIEIIAPAIEKLNALGLVATGPHAADTMFHARSRRSYDAALCMLHDQALIPAKTLAFDEAVNVTLGLPFIRTSPDHGAALDIAGKGIARADSLVAAIKLAALMAEKRRNPS